MREELQDLLSLTAGTRLLDLSGGFTPRSALPFFHGQVQTQSNQFLTFIFTSPPLNGTEDFCHKQHWNTQGHPSSYLVESGHQWGHKGEYLGDLSKAMHWQHRTSSAGDQLSTPLNEEPFNNLSLKSMHCPTHLFLSNNTVTVPRTECIWIISHKITVGKTKFENFSPVSIRSMRIHPVCLWQETIKAELSDTKNHTEITLWSLTSD